MPSMPSEYAGGYVRVYVHVRLFRREFSTRGWVGCWHHDFGGGRLAFCLPAGTYFGVRLGEGFIREAKKGVFLFGANHGGAGRRAADESSMVALVPGRQDWAGDLLFLDTETLRCCAAPSNAFRTQSNDVQVPQ